MADRVMHPEATHRALSAAIGEGRFEVVPDLAIAYKNSVATHLTFPAPEHDSALPDILQPLLAARDLLLIVRAHQTMHFKKLAAEGLYRVPDVPGKGRTLRLKA